jgi:endonuclease/exonuclease/phosphatase family metal-dependent hydrolase
MGRRTSGKSKATPASIIIGLIVLGAAWLLSPKKPASTTPTSSPSQAGAETRRPPATSGERQRNDSAPSPSESSRESSSPAAASSGGPAPASITIASWNIEWLGNPSQRSGEGKGVAQDTAELAEAIKRSEAAVVALQEISPTGTSNAGRNDEPRSKELDAIAAKLGGGWRYLLFPSRSGDQFTGFLYNSGIVSLVSDREGDSWRVPVPTRRSSQGSGLWVRPPTAVKFSAGAGKTDFVLIVVHMKADFDGDFAKHREEEAKALAALLPDVRRVFKDEDVLILGDTNMTDDNEAAEKTYERAGLKDLNTANAGTHWRGGGTDKIFVPAAQPEFAASSFRVINHDRVLSRTMSPAAYKRRFSDHYMVSTTVRLQDDDD